MGSNAIAMGLGVAVAAMISPPSARADLADQGHAIYQEACAVCHGAKGEGDGPLAPELRTAPADLTRIAKSNGGVFPDAAIAETIDGRRKVRSHGPDSMPIWGKRFRDPTGPGAGDEAVIRDRIASLIAWLKTIQKP